MAKKISGMIFVLGDLKMEHFYDLDFLKPSIRDQGVAICINFYNIGWQKGKF